MLVIKSEKRLYLMKDGKQIAAYRATFGANPVGHKERQGDERTPEGYYVLDYKNRNSKFYKSIHNLLPQRTGQKGGAAARYRPRWRYHDPWTDERLGVGRADDAVLSVD